MLLKFSFVLLDRAVHDNQMAIINDGIHFWPCVVSRLFQVYVSLGSRNPLKPSEVFFLCWLREPIFCSLRTSLFGGKKDESNLNWSEIEAETFKLVIRVCVINYYFFHVMLFFSEDQFSIVFQLWLFIETGGFHGQVWNNGYVLFMRKKD